MAYTVGDQIIWNDVVQAVFAGYTEDDEESWCDIGVTDTGKQALCSPEVKTFIRVEEDGAMVWSMTRENFAQSVDRIIDPN